MKDNFSKKFKKGDSVIILSGKDKGKTGEITDVVRKDNKVVVSGVNVATVHKKPTQNTPGKILKVEKPIHVSNVSHVEDGKPVRAGFEIGEDGKKVRISKKSKKKIG